MPTPPIDPALLQEAIDVWRDNGKSVRKAAEASGLNYFTYASRLEKAKKRGMHLDPAVKDSMDAVGTGMVPALVWAKTKSQDGTSYSTLLKPVQEDTESLIERLQGVFADIPTAPDVAAPQHTLDDLLTIYPLADVHMGMQAWGQETGEDYDTNIAVDRVTSWVGQAVASSPSSETAIILDVGDLHHGDDQTNMTPRSKHILDVDTRHFKTLDMSIYALATSVDLARAKHARVIVRILPGNHNPTSYMAVMFALAERYRNDDCVEVQKVPGEFFTHEFGKCLIAAHHGDKAKAERMVMFLADEYAEAWGRTRHRYLWTGHLHHHKSADIGGVTWEQLRAVTARDAYAASHSYVARSQLQAITYHRDLGEVQRVKISGP
jgi:hypothetical protein